MARSASYILFLTIISAKLCFGSSQREIDAAVAQLAQKTDRQQILYHWTDRLTGLRLGLRGGIPESLMRQRLADYGRGLRLSGPGIYLDRDPFLWHFMAKGRGELIEFVIPPGLPFIDLNDPSTMRKLQSLGISPEELEKNAKGIILFHQTGEKRAADDIAHSVATVRLRDGIITRRFTGEGLSDQAIADLYQRVEREPSTNKDRVKRYFSSLLESLRERRSRNGDGHRDCPSLFRRFFPGL